MSKGRSNVSSPSAGERAAAGKKHHNPERSKSDIIQDILRSVREFRKATKTRIMQRSCLDWRSFNRHFNGLVAQGFVVKCNPEEGKYELSSRGQELLRRLKAVVELWED